MLDAVDLTHRGEFAIAAEAQVGGRTGQGPIVLLAGAGVELRDRENGELVMQGTLPEGARLPPEGNWLLRLRQGQAGLESVAEDREIPSWALPEDCAEVDFSPAGRYVWSAGAGRVALWQVEDS